MAQDGGPRAPGSDEQPRAKAAATASPSLRRTQTKQPMFLLSNEEVALYVARTPFNSREVRKLHTKFQKLSPERRQRLLPSEICQIEELSANPFTPRILEVFSEDGSGELSFDQFLNMMGAFSHRTEVETKMIWAFAIWDFDGDDLIRAGDVSRGLRMLADGSAMPEAATKNPGSLPRNNADSVASLEDVEIQRIAECVMMEVDPHGWGMSYYDFRSVISRMPDFISNFHINI